eukprot:6200002-Pleurochrysis_carterae.AAC.2
MAYFDNFGRSASGQRRRGLRKSMELCLHACSASIIKHLHCKDIFVLGVGSPIPADGTGTDTLSCESS